MLKIQPLIPAAGAWLILYLLTACAGLGARLDPPRISLADIRVQDLTGFETVFRIQLRVFNTNDVNLKIKGLEADLEVNGRPFATGVSNTAVEIPSFGSELVSVTMYSSVIDIIKSIRGLNESQQLQYRLRGKIRAGGADMMPATLPFESEGRVMLNPSRDSEK